MGKELKCPFCGADLTKKEDGTYYCEMCDISFQEENGELVQVPEVEEDLK